MTDKLRHYYPVARQRGEKTVRSTVGSRLSAAMLDFLFGFPEVVAPSGGEQVN